MMLVDPDNYEAVKHHIGEAVSYDKIDFHTPDTVQARANAAETLVDLNTDPDHFRENITICRDHKPYEAAEVAALAQIGVEVTGQYFSDNGGKYKTYMLFAVIEDWWCEEV